MLVGAEVDTEVLLEILLEVLLDMLLEVAVVKVDGTLVLETIQLQALLTLLAIFPVHAATAKEGTISVSKS